MALTFLQYSIDSRADPLPHSIAMLYDYYSPVFSEIPMENNGDSMFHDYEHVQTLPDMGWRGFNQAIPESSGTTIPYREYLKILSGEVKIDVQLANEKSIAKQTRMKVQASVNAWDTSYFEGSPLIDPNSMVGLRSRIGGSQLIQQASGGGPISLAKLNALRDAVPYSTEQEEGMSQGEGIRVVMYMARSVRNWIDARIESQTGSLNIMTTKDAFGKRVEMWRGAVIKVVEQKGTGTTYLDYDEDPGDGTADTASVYCVAYGSNLLHGLFRTKSGGKALDTYKVPQMEAEPRMLIRYEGMYGISCDEPRAMARLYGITNA